MDRGGPRLPLAAERHGHRGRPTTPRSPAPTCSRILAVDRNQPASIAYSLGAARENARRAREVVSTELWEVLNTTRARMPRKVASDKVHEFFAWVRERSALAVGIIESATSRDEAWQLLHPRPLASSAPT